MSWNVFIDGEVGTTGLQIRDRLMPREEINIVQIHDSARKDPDARYAAFAKADIAILRLPDDAAKQALEMAQDLDVRMIDASNAHRIDLNWVFGFPELTVEHRSKIAPAKYVSNPGCYSTGAIALLNPLTNSGLLSAEQAVCINAISGFTGGGKGLINEFQTKSAPDFFAYAMGQQHKHIPEIMKFGGLTRQPIFAPSVGKFAQGMLVQIPLHLDHLSGASTMEHVTKVLVNAYLGSTFVKVIPSNGMNERIDPQRLNGTNMIELFVHGDDATGCVVLSAVLDNLGKGASGAAVQNLNLMLGVDEATGLRS